MKRIFLALQNQIRNQIRTKTNKQNVRTSLSKRLNLKGSQSMTTWQRKKGK